MYSYRVAVAIRRLGFNNIKIYNGGLKDWRKSGYKIVSRNQLPDITVSFVSALELRDMLSEADRTSCKTDSGEPLITILDLRNQSIINPESPPPRIKTSCRTINLLMDDLLEEETVRQLPTQGLLVTVTETGNRDDFLGRYLYKFGYIGVKGLQFGMRAWIKKRYPTE